MTPSSHHSRWVELEGDCLAPCECQLGRVPWWGEAMGRFLKSLPRAGGLLSARAWLVRPFVTVDSGVHPKKALAAAHTCGPSGMCGGMWSLLHNTHFSSHDASVCVVEAVSFAPVEGCLLCDTYVVLGITVSYWHDVSVRVMMPTLKSWCAYDTDVCHHDAGGRGMQHLSSSVNTSKLLPRCPRPCHDADIGVMMRIWYRCSFASYCCVWIWYRIYFLYWHEIITMHNWQKNRRLVWYQVLHCNYFMLIEQVDWLKNNSLIGVDP